jgi:uncharacterized protein (DUF3084 family)
MNNTNISAKGLSKVEMARAYIIEELSQAKRVCAFRCVEPKNKSSRWQSSDAHHHACLPGNE